MYIYIYKYNLVVIKFNDTVYGCFNKIYIVMWHIYIPFIIYAQFITYINIRYTYI